MLFHLAEDFSESTDVAAKNPDKLEQMKQLWFMQASKYKVFPRGMVQPSWALMTPRPANVQSQGQIHLLSGNG